MDAAVPVSPCGRLARRLTLGREIGEMGRRHGVVFRRLKSPRSPVGQGCVECVQTTLSAEKHDSKNTPS